MFSNKQSYAYDLARQSAGKGIYEVVAGTHAGYLDKGHSHVANIKRVSTRVSHVIATDIEEIAFVLGTKGVGASSGGYNVRGIVFDSKGKIIPITVNGESNIRVNSLGIVKTDYVKCDFKKDEIIWTVWCLDTDAPNTAPAYIWLSQENGCGIGRNQDWTRTGLLPPYSSSASDSTTTNGYGYAPIAVLGKTRKQSVVSTVLIGDSILDGVGENQPNYSSDIRKTMVNGYIERGLQNRFGFSNWGVSNEFVSQFNPTPNAEWVYRKRLLDYIPFNAAIIEYPINDIKGGRTPAETRTNMKALISFLRTKGVQVIYLCTVTPVTTSTDNWATVSNQTVTQHEAARVAHNNDVRNGYYEVEGYFEVADLVETARDSGMWKAGYTTDGIHPVSAGVNEMKKAVNPDKIKDSVLRIN